MKVHLKALGCRLNEAELETWSQEFLAAGYQITQNPDDADLMVLNSCAVTSEASRKSRQLVNRLHKSNPRAKMVVTGCHASLNPEQLAENMGVDLVVSNLDKPKLTRIARTELDLPTMPLSATEPEDIALYTRGRHRAFIKIQDGCRYRCTFCIVTHARGEERSRPEQEIINEVNRFVSQGINEVVLTGVHVGGYGSDTSSSLFELVKRLLEYTDIPRIRFASVEPWDLPDNFFTLFENTRVMPHMHLPLQSGSDAILKKMARRCKTEQYRKLVNDARAAVPGFSVTSDIIVGFPGETDELWNQSREFIESIEFNALHIFPYSAREGTKAASYPDQNPKPVKQARARELAEIAERSRTLHFKRAITRHADILWEKPTETAQPGVWSYSGYTPNFMRVEIRSAENLEYKIATAHITGINERATALRGELVSD